MTRVLEKRLIEEYKNREHFTRDELLQFYRQFEPDLNESTFGWRIYNLKKKGIIKSLKTGVYTISNKPEYEPNIGSDIWKISDFLNNTYNGLEFCIWRSDWLNEFTRHQATLKILIIEVEKGFEESVFHKLKDEFRYEAYYKPEERDVDFYISDSLNPVVIKSLLTRSPIQSFEQDNQMARIPYLEKILVDIFADEKLFNFLKGTELTNIYEGAISNYSINFTKFFSYAKRRKKEQEIKSHLLNQMPQLIKGIIND